MKTFTDCIAAIETAAGRKFSDDELDDLLSQLQARQRYVQALDSSVDLKEAALKAADQLGRDLEEKATIAKRNAALNMVKRLERVEWIQRHFGNNLAEGLEAMLVGVNRAKPGARESVASVQAMLRSTYHAGLVADLERSGHLPLFTSGAMDRDIARALWAIGREEESVLHGTMAAEAVDLARVIHKWQEVSRVDANEAGAWIAKETGYITRQSHDPEKIRRAGFATWRRAALDKFDIPKMLAQSGATDVDRALSSVWMNLSAGHHLTALEQMPEVRTPGSVASKVSQDRIVFFKDADAWFDYNAEYGTGNLRESVTAALTRSADAVGLMRVMGTSPHALLDTIKNDLVQAAKDAGRPAAAADLHSKSLDNFMAAVDGTMNQPGTHLWARRAANLRAWEMMSKLGGMVLSQLNDIAVYGSGARYQGRNFFSGVAEAVGGLGRNLSKQETRELASSLGVVLDNMIAEMGRVGTFSEAGSMAKATQLFMKLNLATWWTSHMRTSASLGMSHHMALQAEKSFDMLGAEYQRVLGLYNIDAARWDAIRGTAQKEVDGRAYIVPENVADKETQSALRNYFVDQTSYLALEPDAKTRAYMLQGTRPGTWTGETARFLMQFKSFTGAYMQKIAGRELLGRGYEGDSLFKALFAGNGEFQGLAQIIAFSTILGYGSMSLKDLAKGKTPRDFTDSPEAGAKVFLAALLQGGGAGIYGDFLFGQASRMGSGTLEAIAGPTLSAAGRVVDLYHKGLAGDDVAARSLNEGLNNSPFMNLFYLRQVLNYAVLYRIQEAMNPGYLRRMERAAEKENAQTFLLKPSEFAR